MPEPLSRRDWRIGRDDRAIERLVVRPHYAAVEIASRMGDGCQARLCEQPAVTYMGGAWLVIAMQWSGILARELDEDGNSELIEPRGFW